ncbi:MAG: hypothetical protein IJ745_07830 [Bacteroidales bacterium]|nr:hypothetical protein [Bacteroidales bacterium]
MKKIFQLLVFLLLGFHVCAQRGDSPVVISVADILPNYGLDPTMVDDSAYAMHYLDSLPQNYVDLTNFCVSVRTKAQRVINSIENDYDHRDSLVWIDSNTVLSDYSIYEYRLRRLADIMGRMSIRYSRLEQQRVEAEKEAARQRAIEEAARRQKERDKEAADLRGSIDLHHRSIISACDGMGIRDKVRIKELKDLYYSYLMVYNKYDLSTGHATPESIAQLDELNAFQNDLLENVLGQNSLPSQIENFKNLLKVRCEKENSDVFRSYSRVFKQTSVPVAFADVKEYGDYIKRLQTIINIQNRYMQTIEMRGEINRASENIVQLYGKKYRDVVNSYREVVKSINMVPAFTTNAESINFIKGLETFIAAQQRWIEDYTLLEDISIRSDSIVGGRESKFRDVISAYRSVLPSLVPVPAFKTLDDADRYEELLGEVVRVQQCYQQVIALRHQIERNDDTIMNSRKLDRVVYNSYREFRRQIDLQPSFSSVERGQAFISTLNDYIDMQELCLLILQKRRVIAANADKIESRSSSYRNIAKAYSRMAKVYDDTREVNNNEDLRHYSRQCDAMMEMQEAFLHLLSSEYAMSSDSQLKRETDVEKIKIVVGLK